MAGARGCKKCGGDSRVVRTREEGKRVVRERECKLCKARWDTIEERASLQWVKD